MKTPRYFVAAALGGLVLLASGCGQQKEADPSVPALRPPTEKNGPAATNATPRSALAATNSVTNTVSTAATPATGEAAKAQALIDGAKKAFADGQWTDALLKLTQLSNLELTNLPPEQASAIYDQVEELEKTARKFLTKPLSK